MASTRFPGKPLKLIAGKPMIGHVAARCKLSGVFDEVVIATCDQEIADYARTIGIESVMTKNTHDRATERVEEAIRKIEAKGNSYDIVTLVQGDEPLVTPKMLQDAVAYLHDKTTSIWNLRNRITTIEDYRSKNCVKVVSDKNDYALYYSRASIPVALGMNKDYLPESYKQVAIIPMRTSFLKAYQSMDPTPLEEIESIDMNRILQHGYKIHCPLTEDQSWPVDTPNDLKFVSKVMEKCDIVEQYICNI